MQRQHVNAFIGGAIGFLFSVYTMGHFSKKINQRGEVIKKLVQSKQRSQKEGPNMFKEIKKDKGKKIYVVLNAESIKDIKNQTLHIFKRQQNFGYQNSDSYYEHQTGGSFTFKNSSNNVIAEINDTTISASALDITIKPSSLFHKSQPLYQSFSAVLKTVPLFCLVGRLQYNIERGSFVLDTQFLALNWQQVLKFYEGMKVQSQVFYIFSAICGLISFAFMFPGLKDVTKKTFHKLRVFFGYEDEPEVIVPPNYLQNLVISADPRYRMKCLTCKERTAQIVYQCGHLVQCSRCNENDEGRRPQKFCQLCNKKSNIFTRLYIA